MTESPLSPEISTAVTAEVDRERLRLLEIAYYIAGVVTILGVSVLLIHFSLFLFFGLNPHLFDNPNGNHGNQNAPPPGLFLAFAGAIGFVILLGWTFGAFQIYVGRCLKKRQQRLLILIIAGLECVFIPWGTALGVFTFMAMDRPSMKSLFIKA